MWDQKNSAIATTASRERSSSKLWDAVLACFSRVTFRPKPRALRLAETLALGDRRMLAIVEWHGETLLIGVTPQQINLLQSKGNSRAGTAEGETECAR